MKNEVCFTSGQVLLAWSRCQHAVGVPLPDWLGIKTRVSFYDPAVQFGAQAIIIGTECEKQLTQMRILLSPHWETLVKAWKLANASSS